MNNEANENIELCLPVNPAYVSAARLTAASVANRIGFDIDEIEDIKTAISEACIFIIKKCSQKKSDFKIIFQPSTDSLNIDLFTSSPVSDESDEELGLLMIKALMDVFILEKSENSIKIGMKKCHKKNNLL